MYDNPNEDNKGARTKRKIYKAAEKLFQKYGMDKITVKNITEKAGVAKGTFYIHYQSKWSLIAEWLGTLDLNYTEYFNSIPKETAASVMIDLVTRKIAQILRKDIGAKFLRRSYAAMLLNQLDAGKVINYERSLPEIYKSILLKGVQNGEFHCSADTDFLTRQIMGIFRGTTFEWCVSSCSFDLEEELVRHVGFLLRDLKSQDSS